MFIQSINTKTYSIMSIFFTLILGLFFTACGSEGSSTSGSENSSAAVQAAPSINDNELLGDFDPSQHIPQGLQATHSDRVRISVHVEGFTDGGEASLIGHFGEQRYRAASAPIDGNGRFVFENDEPFREGIYIVALPNNSGFQISLVEGQMDFELKTRSGNLVEDMQVVTPNQENQLNFAIAQFEAENRSQIETINRTINSLEEGSEERLEKEKERDKLAAQRRAVIMALTDYYPNSLYAKFKVGGQNPQIRRDLVNEDGTPNLRKQAYHFRNEFWNSVDFSDERLLNTPVIINMTRRYMDELVPQNADSINKYASLLIDRTLDYPDYFQFFANWITNNFDARNTTIMDPEAVFVHMIQNYFTHERAFWSDPANIDGLQMRASEMEASLVGNQAPNVTANDPDGVPRTLLDSDKDYIIVYIFNPTCEHCMKETPLLVEWHNNNRDLADVYTIVLDTDYDEWTQYLRSANMGNFTNVFDPTNRAFYKRYYVDITPEIYVINPDRTIIAKNLKTFQIDTMIGRDKERRGVQ